MKIVKRTKTYFYVELGDKDMEDVFTSTDLIRVERADIDQKIRTLSDMVKGDNDYQEIIDYPDDWYEYDSWSGEVNWTIPNNVDELITEDMVN